MVTTLDYLRALSGATAAMAMLIATELTLLAAAAVAYAVMGGVDVSADSLHSPLRWATGSGTLALLLSLFAARSHGDIYTYVFRTVPALLLRRTLPFQLIGVGMVELILLATGHL